MHYNIKIESEVSDIYVQIDDAVLNREIVLTVKSEP